MQSTMAEMGPRADRQLRGNVHAKLPMELLPIVLLVLQFRRLVLAEGLVGLRLLAWFFEVYYDGRCIQKAN